MRFDTRAFTPDQNSARYQLKVIKKTGFKTLAFLGATAVDREGLEDEDRDRSPGETGICESCGRGLLARRSFQVAFAHLRTRVRRVGQKGVCGNNGSCGRDGRDIRGRREDPLIVSRVQSHGSKVTFDTPSRPGMKNIFLRTEFPLLHWGRSPRSGNDVPPLLLAPYRKPRLLRRPRPLACPPYSMGRA